MGYKYISLLRQGLERLGTQETNDNWTAPFCFLFSVIFSNLQCKNLIFIIITKERESNKILLKSKKEINEWGRFFKASH